MMDDCQKKVAGKPQAPRSSRGPDPKPKGKGKGDKGNKGASSLDEWPGGREDQPSGEKTNEEVASLFIGDVSRHERLTDESGKLGRRSGDRLDVSGNPTRVETLVPMRSTPRCERIDVTIDSGCAACVLPVGVASAVGMQESNRTPQEYIAANAEKIRELRFKIPTLKFQNGYV